MMKFEHLVFKGASFVLRVISAVLNDQRGEGDIFLGEKAKVDLIVP